MDEIFESPILPSDNSKALRKNYPTCRLSQVQGPQHSGCSGLCKPRGPSELCSVQTWWESWLWGLRVQSHTLACLQGSHRNEWGDVTFLNVWDESLDLAPRSPPCAVSPFITVIHSKSHCAWALILWKGKREAYSLGGLCAHTIFSSLLHKHQFVNTDLLFVDSLCPVSHCPCPWPS